MKQLIAIMIMACVLLFITTGCDNNKLNGYTEISYSEFVEKKNNKDSFPLVIGSSTCSACAMYKVVMEQFIKENQVEVFYIDLSNVTDQEYKDLHTEISFSSTPTTVFYEDGSLTSFYNRIEQAVDISEVKNFLQRNNYIK